MAYVNTTFLPKTNGLVFRERLTARSDKGRVFLYGINEPPLEPLISIIQQPGDLTLESMVRASLMVVAIGNYVLSYQWQFRHPDSSWKSVSTSNMEAAYPDAAFTLLDGANTNVLNVQWFTGTAPTEFRCRVRDTNEDGDRDQKLTVVSNITYI